MADSGDPDSNTESRLNPGWKWMLCMQAVARSAGLVIYSYRFSCCTSLILQIYVHILWSHWRNAYVWQIPSWQKIWDFFGRLGSSCILEMALLVGLRRRASPDGRWRRQRRRSCPSESRLTKCPVLVRLQLRLHDARAPGVAMGTLERMRGSWC